MNSIVIGDVLTFTPTEIVQETSVTHRVIDIKNNGGILTFTTKGDAPSITATETFPANNIIGKVTGSSYFLGSLYTNFFSNKPLVATIILIPMAGIMVYEAYKITKIVKEDKAAKKVKEAEGQDSSEGGEK